MAAADQGKLATTSALTTYAALSGVLSGIWTFINKVVKELDPKWSLLAGAIGALLLTAASDPLDPKYKTWRRPTLYFGLFALNTLILASAALGVEETADEGLSDAAVNQPE